MWWNPPKEYWEQFQVASQLSGSHGEWTQSDDVDNGNSRGHQQGPRRDNLNNRGAKRHGGGKGGGRGFGPKGPKPVHPCNRVPVARCPDQESAPPVIVEPGEDPEGLVPWVDPPPQGETPEPGAAQFHANGAGAAVAGSLVERVRQDRTIPLADVADAGRRLGEYAARKHQRELQVADENAELLDHASSREALREVLRRDLYHQQSLAHTLTHERAKMDLDVVRAATRAAADVAYLDRTRRAFDEEEHREQARSTAAEHRRRLAYRDMHRLKREMAEEDCDVAFEGRRAKLIQTLRAELAELTDPEAIRLHDAKIRAEVERYRRLLPALLEIAHAENALSEARESGKVKDKTLFDVPPDFVRNPRHELEADPVKRARMPWINPSTVGDQNFRHVDVDLVPGVLFTRHKRPGWKDWVLGGLALGWKKTINVRRPDGTFGHRNVDPTNARVLFDDAGQYHGQLSLLASDDRRVCRDILNDYRVLGMQSGSLQAILSSGEGFIVEQKFTHAQPVLVHPTLYKQVTLAATGVSITKNQAAAFVREFKKPWLNYIQVSLFHDTINLACQHAQIYNFHRNRTIARTDDVLGDM